MGGDRGSVDEVHENRADLRKGSSVTPFGSVWPGILKGVV